ncbi:MAG: SDR family oxidoreductase, partial [Balneolaceae bacterium]|nr:SDR family oxidoreductase [Balneolaceae bacterium]
ETVVISGASQGIGRVVAQWFSRSDASLLLVARNQEKLEETRALCVPEAQSRIELLPHDLAAAQIHPGTLQEPFATPSILVSVAGSFLYKTLENTTTEEFQQQLDVNLFTCVNLVKSFLPSLKTLQHRRILAVDSIAATVGLGDSGAYASSKHALLGYLRSLREELRHEPTPVTSIHLGQTYSTSWASSDMDPGKLINPWDVAQTIHSIACLSPQTSVDELTVMPSGGPVAPF